MEQRTHPRKPSWKEILPGLLVTAAAAVLLFGNLAIEGWGNRYYAAGVRSMLQSWSNFFFAAYDPAGFVTVDKPALGFWLQALSAAVFGYQGWALILPQALAAFGSLGLLYFSVRRRFGVPAALVAALALATTPIFVAAARNNTIDSTLTLVFVLVGWLFIRAVETGRAGYLYLAFGTLGLGFNVKMMEAVLVAPALYLSYFLAARATQAKKVLHLFLGSLVFLGVSLSWSTAVDLTPPTDRPFVGSTRQNSEWELILGHNGFDRLGLGRRGDGGRFGDRPRPGDPPAAGPGQPAPQALVREFGFNSSQPGPLRFFTPGGLSYQTAWILLFAGLSAASFGLARVPNGSRPYGSPRDALVLFWGLWAGTEFLYFSFTGGMYHTYYLTTMAPAAAALAGVGFGSWVQETSGWKKWFFPGALAANSLVQGLFLAADGSDPWQVPLVLTVGLTTIGALGLSALGSTFRPARNLGLGLGLAALLAAPAAWSSSTLFLPMNGSNPTAGWGGQSDRKRGWTPSENSDYLADFLKKNQGPAPYALAVPSSRGTADNLIITKGLEIIPLGGFMGSDPVLTLPEFQALAVTGKVPFALAPPDGRGLNQNWEGRLGIQGNQDIFAWIRTQGKLVPRDQWTTTTVSDQPDRRPRGFGPRSDDLELYDLRALSNQGDRPILQGSLSPVSTRGRF